MSLSMQQKGTIGMRVFAVAVALSVTLAAAPVFTQTPAPARPASPATPPPAPQGQKPAAPAPQTPAPAAAAPAPARPFPEGVKYAFVQVQRIASESAAGKAATAEIQALNNKKSAELQEKNKALQAAQQKLESGGSVMNEATRVQLQTEIERHQREIQRFGEDAQGELNNLQMRLQQDFQRNLDPVLQKVAEAKQLHMIFSATDSGLVWGDAALDITAEVIKQFDSSSPVRAAAPAAAAPAAK
jgi:outer membrane protein